MSATGQSPLAPNPESILHERLARGEIAIDEYCDRLAVLLARKAPPPDHDS
jgi:uncharacterized membrane protein